MTRRIFTLANQRMRDAAIAVIVDAVDQSRVEIKGPKRRNDQNAAMWAKLGDIAEQVLWEAQGGLRRLDVEQWKLVFLDALRREHRDQLQLVPNIDRTGFVDISGKHSSDLSEEEMGMLLSIISAFGDQHGVVWSEPKPKDTRPAVPDSVYEEAIR